MFYTGAGRHSSTTANVFCRIYGNRRKTKPIILRDPDRPMFQPSSTSSFLVTLNCSLDQIREIHIWHDISGPRPSWFLEDVIVCHLNTNVTWYFAANRWLDVSTGSKEVECKLKPIPRKILLKFLTMFEGKMDYNLKKKHLWLSLLYKSNSKTFGKYQKMSCCLAVTGMMKLVSIAMVITTQNLFSDSQIRLGPWKVNLGDVYRALVCCGIAFIYRLLIQSLFLSSHQNATMGVGEKNVEGYIRDRLQEINSTIFLDEIMKADKGECPDSYTDTDNENTSSSDNSTSGIHLEFSNYQELQSETKDEENLQFNNENSHLALDVYENQSIEGSHENASSNKAHDLEDLVDILGHLSAEEDLFKVLDEHSHVFQGKLKDGFLREHCGSERLEESRWNSEIEEIKTSDKLAEEEKEESRPESVAWTACLTNPDQIPNIWMSLPFPKHLVDGESIKKPNVRASPRLNEIFSRANQVHCFVVPFISFVVAIAIGIKWSAPLTKSWLVTFGIAIIGQIFVLESFYVVVRAIFFSILYKRPVKEEDLINELESKVWVNEEQETTYYADEVDEDENEPVPMPPTQEEIQKAQEEAGKDRELEDVLKMLCFNVLFLGLLIFISLGNRDSSSYPIRAGLEHSLNITNSFTRGVIMFQHEI